MVFYGMPGTILEGKFTRRMCGNGRNLLPSGQSCQRDAKFLPISTWGKTSGPFEQAPEKCGILISDYVADIVKRLVAGLQLPFRFFHPEMLDIGDGR